MDGDSEKTMVVLTSSAWPQSPEQSGRFISCSGNYCRHKFYLKLKLPPNSCQIYTGIAETGKIYYLVNLRSLNASSTGPLKRILAQIKFSVFSLFQNCWTVYYTCRVKLWETKEFCYLKISQSSLLSRVLTIQYKMSLL